MVVPTLATAGERPKETASPRRVAYRRLLRECSKSVSFNRDGSESDGALETGMEAPSAWGLYSTGAYKRVAFLDLFNCQLDQLEVDR